MKWVFYLVEPRSRARGENRTFGERGSRVYDFKPFYRGAKVTVIGAISVKQVLAVMTIKRFYEF